MACLLRVVSTSSPSSPSGSTRAGFGVHDLRVEMVFEDVQAVVVGALDAHARPDDLRKAVNIERLDAAFDFDMPAHGFGPWLGAENADAQGQFADAHAQLARPAPEGG